MEKKMFLDYYYYLLLLVQHLRFKEFYFSIDLWFFDVLLLKIVKDKKQPDSVEHFNLGTSESTSETPGKFWLVVLGKDGKDSGRIVWEMKYYIKSRELGIPYIK